MTVKRDNPTVRRILDAAASCFGRTGFHATSLREVAEEAGVSKALIHYHFESKETLLFELESYLYGQVADEVGQIAVEQEPGLETAMNALDRLAEAVQGFGDLMRVFVELEAEALRRDDLGGRVQAFLSEAHELILTGLHQTLGPGVAELVLPPERFAAVLLACLHGIVVGGLHLGVRGQAELFEDFKTLLRAGFAQSNRADEDDEPVDA